MTKADIEKIVAWLKEHSMKPDKDGYYIFKKQ